MSLFKDFAGLFFPEVCFNCGNSLFRNEKVVCTRCALHLPETNFHRDPDNPVARVFWGRIYLQAATALYYYRKGGAVQKLIHRMKYDGHKEIGLYLGKLLGAEISKSPLFTDIDIIVPVPLHFRKQKKRGFNQAELIAEGIAEVTRIRINTKAVFREVPTDTQTKKSRYKRWDNVSEIFKLRDGHNLDGKHILVVDDVITTGATMEACLQALGAAPGTRLSAVSIAFAHK